ncbi:MAG: BON domain-containing protein [Fuerstiella sp.]
MRLNISRLFVLAALCCFASTASAQVGQLNGGATGGTTGGGTTGAGTTGGQAGGTTQGLQGLTTQGPAGAAGATTTTPGFVGGADPSAAFVGGGQQTDRNNSRQFRAVTQNGVPVGGTQTNTGTPRQVPVSLKIGFAVPTASAAVQLMPRSGVPFQQVAANRIELRQVKINVVKGVAVLVGQVPTESSRRLAANLVRLRPGIKTIDNRILIAKPTLKPRPVLPRS